MCIALWSAAWCKRVGVQGAVVIALPSSACTTQPQLSYLACRPFGGLVAAHCGDEYLLEVHSLRVAQHLSRAAPVRSQPRGRYRASWARARDSLVVRGSATVRCKMPAQTAGGR